MPKPGKKESREKFLNRCMGYPDMQKYEQKQRYAICNDIWRNKGKKKKKKKKESSKLNAILLYPNFVEPQRENYLCPKCNSNNRSVVSGIVYSQQSIPQQFNFSCGWCGKDWYVASTLILNNIIEDQMKNLYNFTRKVGKEFGALVLSTSRGILLDMCQIGEDRSINLELTRGLEADERLLGSFHCHPISDSPSYWDIGTFLKAEWEKISCVAGAEGTITVMSKTGKTKKLKSTDIDGWREENIKKGKYLKELSVAYKFETYRGKPTKLSSISKSKDKIVTLKGLIEKST